VFEARKINTKNHLPHVESPLDSAKPPVTDEGGVLGDGLDTDGFGEGFVVDRNNPGDCAGVVVFWAGTKVFVVAANPSGAKSGRGSDLNTVSKRARGKCNSSAKPL
jgi:hypothetical protein